MNRDLAKRLQEVLLDGKWIANTNFKEQITSVGWHEANQKVFNLNSIAQLTFHVNYYLKGLLHVFEGGELEIHDKFSFDMPEIKTEQEWYELVNEFLRHSERFVFLVEKMDEDFLNQPFVRAGYGSNKFNIEAQIEHSYYHLGQISLLKKLILKN